ncbi:MAG: hypothetical protein JSS60_05145 [Verrucomicrobia bacterium]|nr:hypothetical protein [Verrucomicrobiota bacterium]
MVSLTRLISGVLPAIDSSIFAAATSALDNGRVTLIANTDYAARLSVNAAEDCMRCIPLIPKAIGNFFAHRYADVNMFFKAWSSMGGTTTSQVINRRVNDVFQLRTTLQNCGNNRQQVLDRFNRLDSQTRTLFFYTDTNYLNQFRTETNPARIQEIREEIFRECDQVISFQRTMTSVNAFFRMFSGIVNQAPATTHGRGPRGPVTVGDEDDVPLPDGGFDWGDWLGRIIPGGDRIGGGHRHDDEIPLPVTVPRGGATTVRGFDVAIPDTVAYVQNAVPAQVQQKADEITRLKAQYDLLPTPPPAPAYFTDPVMMEIMTIPVFDASHPVVQTGLPALRAAIDGGATNATTLLNDHRNVRHIMEKDSLEAHIASGRSFAPAKCPQCRHPADGGIRREFLRIDTGLQDEILQFLRRAVPGGTTTT